MHTCVWGESPLAEGQLVPQVTLKDAQGKDTPLSNALGGKPTLLVIYRGGWCMYCNRHLKVLKDIQPALKAQGIQIIGISPDPVDALNKSTGKLKLDYQLLSDHEFKAIRAFGLGFIMDAATIKKYREYKIPLYSPPGMDEKVLPVPAVYLVDAAGRVVMSHYDPDYKQRLTPEKILAAAQSMK